MSELPTGTVTLLLADIEGSTRLWDTQPDTMRAAVTCLDEVISAVALTHHGARPLEQGEGDSFVIAFQRAADAVACAVDLQRAPLSPIALRIGLHTGDIQLRDENNYVGPTINRAARLRDLAHGGQTVLSVVTEALVAEQLPPEVTLIDLGTHALRDLPRPERVAQLCHPDLHNEFPPLRTAVGSSNLPIQLTNFIGRQTEIEHVRRTLDDHRLVTLTGAGGAGKTRLAVHVAAMAAGDFGGVCYIDLAPINHPEAVAATAARTLNLPDQPGRSTTDTLRRFLRDRHLLLVLDNCEHLLEASAQLATAILADAQQLSILATSREPLGVAGEATWQVPSLPLADEAVALFADRARLARAGFSLTEDNISAVTEICRRLDGMPLAIELAAARVRTLTLAEIIDSLHDRFRILTGGSRTSVRRQQTLRASVDWSHALLTDNERILFRRLAVFLGSFDLAAVRAVTGDDSVERYQVFDQITLLADKSLVVVNDSGGITRYRLLETMRQYALEKLGESGEADATRSRHRDYYTAMVSRLSAPAQTGHDQRVAQAEAEMDNLRGAFEWSLENHDTEEALALASSLHVLWWTRGRVQQGRAWFNAALPKDERPDVSAEVYARALAEHSFLDTWVTGSAAMDKARQALAIAREVDEPTLLARALTACGFTSGYTGDAELAATFFSEAGELARTAGDGWSLIQILAWQSNVAESAGFPLAARPYAEEGCALAEAIDDRHGLRICRLSRGWIAVQRAELATAIALFHLVQADAEAAHDEMSAIGAILGLGVAYAHQGQAGSARAVAQNAINIAGGLDTYFLGLSTGTLAIAELANGDTTAARAAGTQNWQQLSTTHPDLASAQLAHHAVNVALAEGDLPLARHYAETAVSSSTGWHLALAQLAWSRVALAEQEADEAERHAHDAVAAVANSGALLPLPDILEHLAALTLCDDPSRAARILGAASAFRERTGVVRFPMYDAAYDESVATLGAAMAPEEFTAAWDEGAGLSTDEAIAYVQRGRGERRRSTSGWDSITRAELDVVKLAGDGLGNKEIAARLFVSPRTVQAHLSHIYSKLGLTSRVQLAQEANRRAVQLDEYR
ncbi:helix-turn-helix transcriptional regulator [Mycolicibacterium llatzerense]|uniref:helix-turn-helix transcriptional regulator n=1 Tax=Mycolicibacterium llatzerense TaxID=280871 RepID=UPI0021B55CDD|nr:LuxR family transcriptional regulator [Mycolicibacterium llatzerense]MCT7366028.1 transcriptional regulator [Mycolicibacterium llatzerense]